MQFKRKLKIFTVLLTMTYGTLAFTETPPQANRAALGSTGTAEGSVSATRTTTNTPPAVTTVPPMDPTRDSQSGSDATMKDQRARGEASGTVTPETTSPNPVE